MQNNRICNSASAKTLCILSLLFFLSACTNKTLVKPQLVTRDAPEIVTVAILPFTNNSVDQSSATSGLGQDFTEHVFEQLTGQPDVVVLDRESIEKVLEELSLSSRELTETAGRLHLGKLLGAQYLVTGSYMAIGKALRMDARVIEVESGRVEGIAQQGTLSGSKAIETALSKKVAERLFKKAALLTRHLPGSSQDHLQRGLVFERKNKPDQALKHYQKALKLDSSNQVARSRMDALLLKELE